ncbi:MAG: ABC transporter substrate-binding protein [Rhodospirillales bacterium]|nr:ABC transporter substrate-binding protein [Rhodospirillales bacterium]
MIRFLALTLCAHVFASLTLSPAAADEVPYWEEMVASGELPPMAERLPSEPLVVDDGREIGTYGGDWTMLITRSKDTRLLVVFGYARLVGYNTALEIVPDILESYEVKEGRIFTFHLREGHRWSDGHPLTAEDFRYWWEDVANNEELAPSGPPSILLVDGQAPAFEVIDETTIRYTWDKPNPDFLPALASASPIFLYRPAHFMKQYHADYGDTDQIAQWVEEAEKTSWASLHNAEDDMYKFDSDSLPTLQPWTITNEAPAQRFVGERNPYYYKVDAAGQQLPYMDQVLMNVVDSKLVPLKTWSGESDLQARALSFSDFTFLKEGETHSDYTVNLWQTARGSQLALYPNLCVNNPVWNKVVRDVRFRRALSQAIDRTELNQVIYYGLGIEGQNTVLPASPLFDPHYREVYASFDIDEANRLLDDMGLTERNSKGIRLLPDGRPMEIIVETAGENTEETDILELVHDHWLQVGVKMFSKPLQREVLRNRIFACETLISIWFGNENGIPSAAMSPSEFAPTSQQLFMWPTWGQYYETGGEAGRPIDMDGPQRLMELYLAWRAATSGEEREAIWKEILTIYSDGVYSIGLVAGTLQPIVTSNRLHNVPTEGLYNWDPGAQLGMYQPDTFFFTNGDDGRP